MWEYIQVRKMVLVLLHSTTMTQRRLDGSGMSSCTSARQKNTVNYTTPPVPNWERTTRAVHVSTLPTLGVTAILVMVVAMKMLRMISRTQWCGDHDGHPKDSYFKAIWARYVRLLGYSELRVNSQSLKHPERPTYGATPRPYKP